MRRYFDDPPTMSGDFPLPKGRANVAVYELMSLDGEEIFENPIGRGWTSVPLKASIIAETVLGVIKIVSLPHTTGDSVPDVLPDDGVGIRPPRRAKRKRTECPDGKTLPLL